MGIIERMGREYTFRRFSQGRYVNGKWVEGDEVVDHDEDGNEIPFSMVASIQRMTSQETQSLPEGQRDSEWIRIYTSTRLYRAIEADHIKGDVVIFNDREYEVMKLDNWGDTRMPHFKAMAVLLEQKT